MSVYNFLPLNLAEEKKKFFFDPLYNPQFIYEQPIPEDALYKYGPFGGEISAHAKRICDEVIEKWGSESKYLDEVDGRLLNREETTKIITEYLTACGLEKKVTLRFSQNFIPRTHIDGYVMNIRLPIDYREFSIRGMLHHEIGTHVYRRLNDHQQLWFQKRDQYKLNDYLESEEGLASLHYFFESKEPYMWIYALQYFACFLATTMSFSQVYAELKKYIDDRDRRFKITLRAKRGIADMSQPGGLSKDQVYLRGVIKITKWLQANDFDITRFYIGKISVEDLDRAWHINPDYQPIVPPFFTEDTVLYKKRIQKILKTNGFL